MHIMLLELIAQDGSQWLPGRVRFLSSGQDFERTDSGWQQNAFHTFVPCPITGSVPTGFEVVFNFQGDSRLENWHIQFKREAWEDPFLGSQARTWRGKAMPGRVSDLLWELSPIHCSVSEIPHDGRIESRL